MATERFAIGAQAAGFISFKESVSVNSGSAPGGQIVDIPEGMISIGGNGRGYVISEQTYTFSPPLTEGTWVLYASDPIDATGNSDGIAEISHELYSTYIAGGGHASPTKIYHGDTNSRRAFCYFRVDSATDIVETSVRTLTSFAYEEQQEYLEKIGFYTFGHSDSGFEYRGNYWDEDVRLATDTQSWDTIGWGDTITTGNGHLVFKKSYPVWEASTVYAEGDIVTMEDATGTYWEYVVTAVTAPGSSGVLPGPTWPTSLGGTVTDGDLTWTCLSRPYGYYDKCIADVSANPEREVVVGIAEEERGGTAFNNFVITSGIVDLGEDYLPNQEFPVGTYLYLTDDTYHITNERPAYQVSGTASASLNSPLPKGNIVRDIDFWTASTIKAEGDLIVDDSVTQYVWRCTTGGTTDVDCPDFSAASKVVAEHGATATTVSDGTVTWTCESIYNQQDFKGRKIRIGVSLGYGTMLLIPGFSGSLIDDHDESANAHQDIQDAMAKAGIYVYNQSQGVTDFIYRGQSFDEYATFDTVAPVADYDLVYLASDGMYYQAQNISTSEESGEVCGMAYGVSAGSGTVLSGGFIQYNTSAWNDGNVLYLSKTVAGGMVNEPYGAGNIVVGKVIKAAAIDSGGYILLSAGSGAGESAEYTDYSVHEHQAVTGVTTFDFVYRHTTPDYRPALNDENNLLTKQVIGMAHSEVSNIADILTQGFSDYDYTTFCDEGTANPGDTLYLSSTNAGHTTTTRANSNNIKVGTCITDGATGTIYIDVDFEDDYTVDSNATFNGVTDAHVAFVYRNTGGDYRLAVNDSSDLPASKVIGLSHNVDTNVGAVITSGFVTFDTTSANTYCDVTCSVGDTLYLSSSTAGGVTNVKQQTNNIKVGTVISTGVSGTIYIDIQEESQFQDNAIDYEANFNALVDQYDIVYGSDNAGSLEYNQAISDGTEKSVFLGVAYSINASDQGIVITQGYVDMGDDTATGTSSGAGSLGYLASLGTPLEIGDKVYLSTTTAGLLSKDITTIEVGKYVGTKTIGGITHYILLLSSSGGGSGSGDVTAEDLTYLNLLNSEPFTHVYYDIFNTVNSLDHTSSATYAANTTSYTGAALSEIGQVILDGSETAYSADTHPETYVEDDLRYEDVQGWIWKVVVPGTSHTSYTPEWDFIGLDPLDLEAFYTFDNYDVLTVGGLVTDEIDSTTNHELEIVGATVTEDTSGKSDSAFIFDGTAYLINNASGTGILGDTLGTADPLSVSFWFKVDTMPTGTDLNGIFEIGTGLADGEFSIYLSSTHLHFSMNGTSIGTTPFTDTLLYHHVYAEYDGTSAGTAKLYLDGTEVISLAHTIDPVCTGKNVYIANFYDSTVGVAALVPFTGRVDEFRIYSRVLTSTERYYLVENAGEMIYKGARITDKSSLLTWEAVRPRTDYRFFVNQVSDATCDLTIEYTTDTIVDWAAETWVDITDEVTNRETILDTTGFTKLALRFTWGGSGDIYSFGCFYAFNDSEQYTTQAQLHEVYYNDTGSDLTTGDTITLPNSGHYNLGDNSLKVTTLSGVRLFESTSTYTYHYTELNNRTIMLDDFTLPGGDSIVFECQYGYIDSSVLNYNTLNVEHVIDPSDTNYGKHSFEDEDFPGQEWKPVIKSGSLVFIPL